jgi:site-specific DNA-methyltransferase (adenine-specific)
VHLVVTSPPYNVGIEYDMHADDMGTHLDMLTDVWRRCYEVMEEGARICVVVPFGVGRTPWVPFAARIMETLQSAGFVLRGQIVWDKNTTGNRTSWGSWRMPSAPALRDTTESIVVAHKGSGTLAIPDDVLCVDDDGRKYAPWLSADYFMELAQDHWAIAPESAQRVKHPAPYPVELVTRLIHFYAFPGAHVLDPFGGSGTTGVAAVQQGCAATLFDISAQYCQQAQERIDGYRNS